MATEDVSTNEKKVCPVCNKEYRGHPAISRKDNSTPICPLCGTREALQSLGINETEIEDIVATIPKIEDK